MVFSSNVHLFIKNSPKIIYINLSFHCIILSKLKQYFLKVGGYMNKTVLIVEDEIRIRFLVRDYFKKRVLMC